MAEILIIEDDAQMLRVLIRMLKKAGHSVHGAANGVSGILLFEQANPALIITDIVMPEMEGIETIRELRRRAPTVPILAISGSLSLYLHAATKLGASAALEKPFAVDELLVMIEELLAIEPQRTC